jgi:hypothetical protein
MKYLLQFAFCILIPALPARAQLVGTVDLTHPLEPQKVEKPAADLPNGCTQLGGGFADGFVRPDNGQRREISLEVIKSVPAPLALGAEFELEIRLKNTGRFTIQIPWSNDPATVSASPDNDQIEYESGEFDVSIADGAGRRILLKSLSRRLFGSNYATGSEIKIAPGQWVSVAVRQKLEPNYNFDDRVDAGQATLTAEWRQARHHWHLDRVKCEVWRGASLYYGLFDEGYYDQHPAPTEVTVTTAPALKATRAKAQR